MKELFCSKQYGNKSTKHKTKEMLFAFSKPFLSTAITTIVSPHGMTDYIHAKQFGLLRELYIVHASTISTCLFLHLVHLKPIIHNLFILCSAIHFRNDMPLIIRSPIPPKFLQLILSTLFVIGMHYHSPEWFIAYMIFIHTPNHYRLSWEFLRKDLGNSFKIVFLSGFLLYPFRKLQTISPWMMSMIQALVIAHIVYQEKFVFTDLTTLLRKQRLFSNEKIYVGRRRRRAS